ncbi:MAG: hypothetical protein M3P85_01660 [Actinomycetota bacterium]|nr:hypothetical protein [Actinomycetota bacterium]
MSLCDRTGLGPLEQAILFTLDDLGARCGRPYRKSALVLVELERRAGFGPRYAYEALCDLARPWAVMLPLVDARGNLGSPDDPAAEPRYTECRLSQAGMLAVASGRGEMPPLPLGLINGTHYRGGTQPSFDPTRLVAALRLAPHDPAIADGELLRVLGPPAFPTRCGVRGEIHRLIKGRRAVLRLSAVIETGAEGDNTFLHISNLPPGVSPTQLVYRVLSCVSRRHSDDDRLVAQPDLALHDVEDLSARGETKIRCRLAEGADPEMAMERLLEIWGVTIDVSVQLPGPLAELLRSWLRQHAVADTPSALERLGACV